MHLLQGRRVHPAQGQRLLESEFGALSRMKGAQYEQYLLTS